jgi:hypothetical protein
MSTGTADAPRRFADLDTVAWANGRGVTTTLAAGSTEDFLRGSLFTTPPSRAFGSDWRVSVARIDGPSEFSTMVGFDRVIVGLGHEPLELVVDGRTELVPPLSPFAFAGEARVRSTSTATTLDLNLFGRRGVAVGELRVGASTHSAYPESPKLVVDLATLDHWWTAGPFAPQAGLATVTIASI